MIFDTVMWVGRAGVFVVGLAVILALTVGLASTALAGTGVGARFDLGKANAVNQINRLVGSVAGPSLLIDNISTAVGATALELQVEPGKPPFKVNSTTEVQGLNVDSLDSKNSSDFLQESSDRDDFLPRKTYDKGGTSADIPGNFASISATCDTGDVALSGGYRFGSPFGDVDIAEERTEGDTYKMTFGGDNSATAHVTCADFPPLRP
jgi:hypothetical protein